MSALVLASCCALLSMLYQLFRDLYISQDFFSAWSIPQQANCCIFLPPVSLAEKQSKKCFLSQLITRLRKCQQKSSSRLHSMMVEGNAPCLAKICPHKIRSNNPQESGGVFVPAFLQPRPLSWTIKVASQKPVTPIRNWQLGKMPVNPCHMQVVSTNTLPETNSSAKVATSQKERIVFQSHPCSGAMAPLVSGRVILLAKRKWKICIPDACFPFMGLNKVHRNHGCLTRFEVVQGISACLPSMWHHTHRYVEVCITCACSCSKDLLHFTILHLLAEGFKITGMVHVKHLFACSHNHSLSSHPCRLPTTKEIEPPV